MPRLNRFGSVSSYWKEKLTVAPETDTDCIAAEAPELARTKPAASIANLKFIFHPHFFQIQKQKLALAPPSANQSTVVK
jgi:hypothetical protein